jgi:hypothetical protein
MFQFASTGRLQGVGVGNPQKNIEIRQSRDQRETGTGVEVSFVRISIKQRTDHATGYAL